MSGKYTDRWGEEREALDPLDWSKWPEWQDWKNAYDWRDGTDFLEQDIIVWRENIIVNRNARKPNKPPEWVRTGERLVIAHVRNYESQVSDWVYLVVIHSNGDEALPPDEKIKRRKKNILRNGVRRWPRSGRAAVDHQVLEPGRTPDDPKNVRRAPVRKPPSQSRFLSKSKGRRPGRGEVWQG